MLKGDFSLFGGQVLPPPLSDKELQELLTTNNEQSRNKITLHNLRLVIYIAKKFENTDVPLDELISIGSLGLLKAVNSYKVERKTKFATYATTCIENQILMYLRHDRKWSSFSSLEAPVGIDDTGRELTLADIIADASSTEASEVYENREAISDKLTDAINSLSDRECFIFLYKLGGKTQRDIESSLGISQSYVSRILGKICTKLKKQNDIKNNTTKEKKYIFYIKEEFYYWGFSKKYFSNIFVQLDKFSFNFNLDYKYYSNYTIIKLPRCSDAFVAVADIISSYNL